MTGLHVLEALRWLFLEVLVPHAVTFVLGALVGGAIVWQLRKGLTP